MGDSRPRTAPVDAAIPAHASHPASHTIAHQNRDFPEWHRGIARYGFWAVVVDCPHWLEWFEAAKRHVACHVHADYHRQPHVTIAAAGLLDEAHLSQALRQRQDSVVRAMRESAFQLQAGPLDGFTSSPHIVVHDPAGALSRLRAGLHAVRRDDPAPVYRPHLTVGLYRDAFALADVHRHLAAFDAPAPAPLQVREVSFCAFRTHELQGRFDILDTIPLEGA